VPASCSACGPAKPAYSTPSDLVRFAPVTEADSVNGELAAERAVADDAPRPGIVVAVASNVAHANTAALPLKVADVFAEQNKAPRRETACPPDSAERRHGRNLRPIQSERSNSEKFLSGADQPVPEIVPDNPASLI
jgi:hypothetical protein